MHFVRKILVFVIVSTITVLSEPSVYGGNNGFYNADKVVAKNKKTIAALQNKITQQNERIDGLMSIVEGLSATVNELQNRQTTDNQTKTDTALLHELGSMIDKINASYVSKDELQKVLNGHTSIQKVPKQVTKVKTKAVENTLDHQSVSILYSEGVRLFVKRRYDEAKKRFVITDTKGHKPAASNYYLGEIAYYTKQYEDAIFYFKKSAGLYDKASYIDTLLLHTAIALEKNGEKEQARAFYENIIENYEGKKTASIAKDKLKKL